MKRRGSSEEALYLDLLRTVERLGRPVTGLLKAEDLSPNQYNVLRILRGAEDGLTCGEIGERMITRDPDITRLVDRLQKRKLVGRKRDTKDRRVVLTRILPAGLELLARLDGPVLDGHWRLLGHLSADRQRLLRQLLEECRAELE